RRHTRWPRDWSSDVCSSDLMSEQRKIVGEMPGDEELPAHELAPGRAHARGDLGTVQQMADPERRALDRVHGVPRDAVDDLLRERSEEHTSELQSRGHLVCRL